MAGADIRWRQRFENYSRAVPLLRSALEHGPDSLNGQLWVDMLDHRNALSHKYGPTLLGPGLEAIRVRYLPALEALHRYLEEQPE